VAPSFVEAASFGNSSLDEDGNCSAACVFRFESQRNARTTTTVRGTRTPIAIAPPDPEAAASLSGTAGDTIEEPAVNSAGQNTKDGMAIA
jgi:hypothetical protein